MTPLLSTATVTTVGLVCKLFLNSGLCSLSTTGLHRLTSALEKGDGRGIITVSNHISTLDDPVTWGVLPARYYLGSRTTRWSLGASEILFTNPFLSTFFRLGQTLETFRGRGIYQPAVDTAISKLNDGGWVHLYGEGKINQPHSYTRDEHGQLQLSRFKWGVGRMLMETKTTPVVIPMWISGFDQLMPEGRPFPQNYLPRLGAKISITFGEPIPTSQLRDALDSNSIPAESSRSPLIGDLKPVLTGGHKSDAGELSVQDANNRTRLVRQNVTAIIHQEVQALGRAVSQPHES